MNGRKEWRTKLRSAVNPADRPVWIHVASLGEFEQGRPLIEKIKSEHPAQKIVLSFFSPSGYEIRKDYALADQVIYLPMDSRRNAKDLLDIINPSLAIFVKYEFWYHYLYQLKKRNIPTLLVSAAFRKEQPFFQWYGGLFRKMLGCYTALFVQDEEAKRLLASIGIHQHVFVSGDTRYDRVAHIAASVKQVPVVEQFKGNDQLLIAGSSWPEDEKVLRACLDELPAGWKLVIAPHEIDKAHTRKIQHLFGDTSILYSEYAPAVTGKKVLIIDNIGLLSSLYAYGEIAFIGGGFNKGGIHNILEPAVFGLPVVFGPVYRKFVEANKMVSLKMAFPVEDAGQAKSVILQLIADETARQELQSSIRKFMQESMGASQRITAYIKENSLL